MPAGLITSLPRTDISTANVSTAALTEEVGHQLQYVQNAATEKVFCVCLDTP